MHRQLTTGSGCCTWLQVQWRIQRSAYRPAQQQASNVIDIVRPLRANPRR